MDKKIKRVLTALKGRKGVAHKKGVNLLGIVQKLTAKRKAVEGKAHELGESPKKESVEDSRGED
jgi:hypothetical protein